MTEEEAPQDDPSNDLWHLLDGGWELPVADSLIAAVDVAQSAPDPTDTSFVLALDANVLLNLGKGRTGADVIDYLSQIHDGPLIVPSQTLLEFWNNHLNSISGVADRLRDTFGRLEGQVKDLDPTYKELGDGAQELLDTFHGRFGHVLEERVSGELKNLLVAISKKAVVPQLPRSEFAEIADVRKAAKVPPGFKDEQHGDFFVWAELLLGVRLQADMDVVITRVVLVTDDKKSDWSTKGTTHPYLVAEMSAWAGASFETWTLADFQSFVKGVIAPPLAPPDKAEATKAPATDTTAQQTG